MKYEVIENNKMIDSNYIKKLNELYEDNPHLEMCIDLSSTKGLSSELLSKLPKKLLIRVAGGYEKERVIRNKNKNYDNGETGIYYIASVIYTRDELIKIVKEIEQIESEIHQNWSPLQKIIYIYDKLKREIVYFPNYQDILAKEKSSLRGLITKQTACAGFAMIFKEIMERIGIDCEYVEGYTTEDFDGAHAWNIISLDGKKYPIDLPKDNAWLRKGNTQAFDSFTEDIKTFASYHFPKKEEKTQNYLETLSQFDKETVELIIKEFDKQKEYSNTIYHRTRKDGSKFIITDIGYVTIDGKIYFRYYFEEISKAGKRQLPLILYSEDNITAIIYDKFYNREIPEGFEEAIDNVLFSLKNIQDSVSKTTFYLGSIEKTNENGEKEFVTSTKEIIKPEKLVHEFSLPSKIFKRSDGTTFIIQQTHGSQHEVNGLIIYEYDIIETITKNNKSIVKRNTVYTEKNFFNSDNQNIADKYLSRTRIDTISDELGGYLGYFQNSEIKYTPELLAYFKNTEISINKKQIKNKI